MRTIAFLQTSRFWDKNVFSNLLNFVKIVQLWHSDRDPIKLVNCGKLEFISTVSFP